MIGNFPAVLNFNWLFLKLNSSFVTNCRFALIIDVEPLLRVSIEDTEPKNLEK